MSKVSLPLSKLNDLLDGGIEDGSNVLIMADLAVDKMRFGSSLVDYRLEEDDNLVYFINNKLPRYVKEHLKDYGSYESQISFVDGFSKTVEKESEEEFSVDVKATKNKKEYIEESIDVVKDALEAREGYGSTFVLDSIDSWVGSWDAMEEFLTDIKGTLESTNTVAYYLLPNLGFDEESGQLERLTEMFDYVLHLKGLERSGNVLKYIDIRKPETDTKVPFDVTESGLVMYVPKMIVTGPYNAGKSTTVKNMSEESVSVDRLGTTVALDHGKVKRNGIKADLFGTPGQKRFDWALNFLGRSIFGNFLILDSRNPDYDRAKDMVEKLRAKDIPTVILANFQNKEDAIPPESIEDEMDVVTLGVDALHGKGLDEALDKLFEKILSQHSWYYT
ncbi:MAG: 50S ribosome-binding GTPase [Candidatus Nanohaloarchaeota archaeon QJJ-9]|nr:50S ribosome-binding GTPase [Candidatus Nanohaloarchaeota archaeon QJJ-9]